MTMPKIFKSVVLAALVCALIRINDTSKEKEHFRYVGNNQNASIDIEAQ